MFQSILNIWLFWWVKINYFHGWGIPHQHTFSFVLLYLRNDKKMDRLLTGVGDGCDSCLAPRSSWTDEDAILEGFPMDRDFEHTKQTWANLPRDGKGELVKRAGDFDTRFGICNKPESLRETFSFAITHKVSF